MSKGSTRRPTRLTSDEMDNKWNRAFGKRRRRRTRIHLRDVDEADGEPLDSSPETNAASTPEGDV